MRYHFACNSCGRCCENHHIPLTLDESRRWAEDGGQLVVLVEAFMVDGPGFLPEQREHLLNRSFPVGEARLIITVAGLNPGRCRYLQDDNRCGQYDQRPLVCRIYPAEINPHIAFNSAAKACDAEVWQAGPLLIASDRVMDTELVELIERSRQADRADIARKVALVEAMGISVAALKGEGYTAWLPASVAWLQGLAQLPAPTAVRPWQFQVTSHDAANTLQAAGLNLGTCEAAGGVFIAA